MQNLLKIALPEDKIFQAHKIENVITYMGAILFQKRPLFYKFRIDCEGMDQSCKEFEVSSGLYEKAEVG
ncbi:MAG: hypothetical protein C0190_02075 [Thermodesulfobacterium geofontis]|uniref:Uncharacterized protein n=1 Tax=Thermodesulfobacterium geofontis TaxID=1295609 RepID=A0A2N7PPP8_9BACT|nr:MAG: hypothetical protein C0190_02075 [Thermodesulfobacterium geofontis]